MITTIILTYNEDCHIARAIASVSSLDGQIIVVDSFSTDQTVEIATGLGALVLQNPFFNQAQQFQWALDHAPIEYEWILRLDADEVIEPDLAARIAVELPSFPADVSGVNLVRKHIFMGRFIRHGGRWPLVLLRLFRRGHARIEQRWMDEHIFVKDGRTVTVAGGFADENMHGLTHFTDKHNKYATREAVDVLSLRYGLIETGDELSAKSTSLQASFKRTVKMNVYNRLPFWAGPLLYFLYRYFFQFGFLDGREGLIYHFLQGFWYRFLVGAKVCELDRALSPLPDADARRAKLEALTKLRLGV